MLFTEEAASLSDVAVDICDARLSEMSGYLKKLNESIDTLTPDDIREYGLSVASELKEERDLKKQEVILKEGIKNIKEKSKEVQEERRTLENLKESYARLKQDLKDLKEGISIWKDQRRLYL